MQTRPITVENTLSVTLPLDILLAGVVDPDPYTDWIWIRWIRRAKITQKHRTKLIKKKFFISAVFFVISFLSLEMLDPDPDPELCS
jgi:hypothetical protein